MAKQGRCRKCDVHITWDNDKWPLRACKCPFCGRTLSSTTHNNHSPRHHWAGGKLVKVHWGTNLERYSDPITQPVCGAKGKNLRSTHISKKVTCQRCLKRMELVCGEKSEWKP